MATISLGKRILLAAVALLACGAQAAFAGNVGVNLNINVGEPQRQVVVAPPPPVYVEQPAYVPAETVRIEDDVQFLYPPTLGFYVAVGVPYDLFYIRNSYFLFRDGRWFQAPSSRGPWVVQRTRDLPPVLRRHRMERIRECRTREYAIYNRDRDHYRGKHFRRDKEQWKERQKELKEVRKEERRLEKQERKDEKRYEKEARKEEKRWEKEARKEEKWRDKEDRHDRREGHRD